MKAILLLALLAVPVVAASAEKAPVLGAGYRAMAVPVEAKRLRWIEPGDRVDVLATFEAKLGAKGDDGKQTVTATILQNVIVLSVDHKEGLVELQVNPNESQYVAVFHGMDKGLWLIKRAAGDLEMHPMEMATASKLFR